MKGKFKYDAITIKDIENNSHFVFVCDADNKEVIVDKNKEGDDDLSIR